MFVFTIMQLDSRQKENHILCCHNRAAWTEYADKLELTLLVCVHDHAIGQETEGESLLCCHNRAAWTEYEDKLELTLLVCVHDHTAGQETEGESHLVLP